MIIVKNGKDGRVIGKMDSDAKRIQIGETICDVPNKKTYVVTQKVYNLSEGEVIGLIVE